MDTILVVSLDFTLISVTLNIVLISSGEYLTFWHAATSLGFENYSFILIFASHSLQAQPLLSKVLL